MLALMLVAAAIAAPADYKVTREGVSGCNLFLGPAEADGVVPMRAECHWADVTLAKFDGAFAKWEDHDVFFSSIAESDILGSAGGKTQVRQVHTTKGISDRFIVIDGTRAANAGGGFKYAWTKSAHQSAQPADTVAALRSDGYWEVTPAADGGIDLVHQLSYDPGGSVPGFLVRWFQTGGLEAIVTDLHTYMTTH